MARFRQSRDATVLAVNTELRIQPLSEVVRANGPSRQSPRSTNKGRVVHAMRARVDLGRRRRYVARLKSCRRRVRRNPGAHLGRVRGMGAPSLRREALSSRIGTNERLESPSHSRTIADSRDENWRVYFTLSSSIGPESWRLGVNTAVPKASEPRVRLVEVTSERITAHLADGRSISVPLAWSWRLANATPAQRARFEIVGDGEGVH